MQPFIPLPDGAQLELLYSLDGRTVINRLWFISRQPPITQSTLDDLTLGVANHFETQLLPFLSQDLGFIRVDAQDWTADPPPFISITNVFAPGGNPSASHSANVAVRTRFKGTSSQTFPSNSNFIPGIPQSEVALNNYSNTLRNGIFNAYVNLIDAVSGFGPFPAWRWVITSRRLNHTWRTEQAFSRTDFIQFPSPYVSPRRHRLP